MITKGYFYLFLSFTIVPIQGKCQPHQSAEIRSNTRCIKISSLSKQGAVRICSRKEKHCVQVEKNTQWFCTAYSFSDDLSLLFLMFFWLIRTIAYICSCYVFVWVPQKYSIWILQQRLEKKIAFVIIFCLFLYLSLPFTSVPLRYAQC